MAKEMQNYILVVVTILSYVSFFLGSCSPIHCRLMLTIFGILTITLAVQAGAGLCAMIGYKTLEMHEALPLLMMGIGVDDMFVLCNAVDQTSMKLPATERLRIAVRHAGPSITLTSLTNAVAFFAGTASSMLAIRSFCVYCGVTICMLYTGMLTIYLPLIFWDTVRVERRKTEFCGLCFCAEDSMLFCGGKYLSVPQKEFSGIKKDEESKDAKNSV